jgi:hypothetical protein
MKPPEMQKKSWFLQENSRNISERTEMKCKSHRGCEKNENK